jgi:hypothetical protein
VYVLLGASIIHNSFDNQKTKNMSDKKQETQITKEELEKVKVLNLLMWLQASIYAGDECEPIKWFYNHQTNMLLKRLNDSIQREHGKTITALWNTDGAILPNITEQIDDFTYEMSTYGYWMLPELTEYIRKQKETQPKIEIK